MNNVDNTVYLQDILTCIGKVKKCLQGFDFEEFKTN